MSAALSGSSKIRFESLPDWVSPQEVQVFLGLSRSTVYEMIRCGDIPSRRFRTRIRVPKESLRPTVTGPEAK